MATCSDPKQPDTEQRKQKVKDSPYHCGRQYVETGEYKICDSVAATCPPCTSHWKVQLILIKDFGNGKGFFALFYFLNDLRKSANNANSYSSFLKKIIKWKWELMKCKGVMQILHWQITHLMARAEKTTITYQADIRLELELAIFLLQKANLDGNCFNASWAQN